MLERKFAPPRVVHTERRHVLSLDIVGERPRVGVHQTRLIRGERRVVEPRLASVIGIRRVGEPEPPVHGLSNSDPVHI